LFTTPAALVVMLVATAMSYWHVSDSALGGGSASDHDRDTKSRIAASRIVGALMEMDGYAGSTYSPDGPRLAIYWRGEPSEALRTRIADAAVAFPGDLRVKAAKFTEAELIREATRLSRAHVESFPRIVAIGPRSDGSGLDIELAEGELARAVQMGVDPGIVMDSRYPVRVIGEANPLAH
jgi:hypothetical protein